jgi:ubiquinone biosynthesis protein
LLQKTLLNIEGLGRQLYPDLDLWATAHPFLENWLKDRFHPKSLLQQLKRYGPEWMEQFPQVPQTLFSALKQVQHIGEIAPELHQAAEHFAKQRAQATRTRSLTLIAIGAAIATVASAWPQAGQHLAQLPVHTWALAAVAASAWLLR